MTTQAIELFRSVPRYLTARAVGGRVPGLLSGPLAPMRFVNRKDVVPLGPGWGRVRPLLSGICGSDLATISGKSSFYFSPLVSLPFVPGHEVVGELLDDVDDLPQGTRIALEPVLSCLARGLDPCPNCAKGLNGRCDRVTTGHVSAGLQTGYCADTGGGWSKMFVAHRSQLHPVPDGLSDSKAVLLEPLSCAVHTALRANLEPNANVVIIGAGTVGHPHAPRDQGAHEGRPRRRRRQAREAARVGGRVRRERDRRPQGGDQRRPARHRRDEAQARTRRLVPARRRRRRDRLRRLALEPQPRAPDHPCGRPRRRLRHPDRGRRPHPALVPRARARRRLHRRVRDRRPGKDETTTHSFDLATTIASENPIDGIVGATYPLRRWREAIDHALGAGKLGTLKVAFDPRLD